MKIALAAALLSITAPAVRFETDGLRVGDSLVTGSVLTLRESGGGTLLVSGSVLEPLASTVDVALADNRTLRLDPGVRIARGPEGFVLSTHGGRALRIGEFDVETAVTVIPTSAGWLVGDRRLDGRELHARLALSGVEGLQQQDPDRNLDAMREAARRMEQGRQQPRQARRPKMAPVFKNNPAPGGVSADSYTVRFLQVVSLD